MDKVHRTFVHSLRMIQVSKAMITLMKEKYAVSSDDGVVSCQQLKAADFVGAINLSEIEVSLPVAAEIPSAIMFGISELSSITM